ncbi:Flagellar protein FliS [Pseudobythopirellula maris]|uniref:Flagellar protein FliS n=1 Tax=Pseudobythopirellula maris TaxID=2527991 RepID=A0A5C5ZL95_9BACT|nr:flagellar export chaperone FliS [Pseudobythopirellula maris]TWT88212.1 Flagellar protein FliS [Pseudobythopirellula maris]
MTTAMNRDYLESKVNTASPPQLHLMLIEGALRFGRQAEKALLREDEQEAHTPLVKTIDIVCEMVAAVRHSDSEINQKLTRLYEFVLTRLTMVYTQSDHKLMGEALKILEFERETWKQAAELAATAIEGEAPTEKPAEEKSRAPVVAPHLGQASGAQNASTGLSFEA